MKEGDIVNVYEDPRTQEQLEGEACLIHKLGDYGRYDGCMVERWEVEFREEPGETFERLIANQFRSIGA